MTELAVVGAPFLDLTFEGLERVPQIGEELIARRLHIGPGGTGMQAIGAARLGLETALVAPLGRKGLAGIMRGLLAAEGVGVIGPEPAAENDAGAGVPITALLQADEGVAMATGLGGSEPRVEDVAKAGAGSVVLSLGRLHLAPPDTEIYAVTGTIELPSANDDVFQHLGTARALILNSAEAAALSGKADPEEAARGLTRFVPTAIVTMGSGGVVASQREKSSVHINARDVDVVDATGAGDLFVAAFVWADRRGASLVDSLAWGCLYAGLSVRTPTAFSGALRLNELLDEGLARELSPPPRISF